MEGSEEIRPVLQVAIVGHVDVGKSSLLGAVYYHFAKDDPVLQRRVASAKAYMTGKGQTVSAGSGGVDIEYRFLCDNSRSERDRGNTIEYHSTNLEIKPDSLEIDIEQGQERSRIEILKGDKKSDLVDKDVRVTDCPGHKEFTKNFVTGALQADTAVLLVPASKLALNSSLKPVIVGGKDSSKLPCVLDHQLRILVTYGVPTLLVCVNKMAGGPATNNGSESGATQDIEPYSEENFKTIKELVMKRILKNGFKKTNVVFMPIDVKNHDNLWSKSPNMAWWKGEKFSPAPTKDGYDPGQFSFKNLGEYLYKINIPKRPHDCKLMMVVNSSFVIEGHGTVYSCKVFSGTAKTDQRVFVTPANFEARIKSIEVNRSSRKLVGVGDECGIVLAVKNQKVDKGSMLSPVDSPVTKVVSFIAVINSFGVQSTINEGYSCVADVHVVHVPITFERILDTMGPGRALTLKGTEPECLTWNPTLDAVTLKKAKDLSKKVKSDPKYKQTEDEKKLLHKLANPFTFEPCGNKYLDALTKPLAFGSDVKSAIVRIVPQAPLVTVDYSTNKDIGRFCLRNSGHVVGIGKIVAVKHEVFAPGKKGGAKK